ncbi:MAG: hypothetical protein ACREO1_02555 [Arenimonas sp.]
MSESKLKILINVIIFMTLGLFATKGYPVDSKKYSEENISRINSAKSLLPLEDNLFGDATNGSTGVTAFSVTDIDLPGNNGLEVKVGRVYKPQDDWSKPWRYRPDGLFSEWDLDIPHLHGVFAKSTGWQAGPNSGVRCNQTNLSLTAPPAYGVIPSEEYWSGNHLYLPGKGDTEILHASNNPNKPANGYTHLWATKEQWYFSCLPVTANGVAGDAFLAHSPDGKKYWFNQVVKRNFVYYSNGSNQLVPRDEVWILPTRVEDRFGNYVVYTYHSTNPWKILSISSSDGRNIYFSYFDFYAAGNPHVSSISDGTRTWTYKYLADSGKGKLTDVLLPDGSKWNYQFNMPPEDIAIEAGIGCGTDVNAGFLYAGDFKAIIKHPSGAVGNFTWRYRRSARSYAPQKCRIGTYSSHDLIPRLFTVMSLTSKEITGPGTTLKKWEWTYPKVTYGYDSQCLAQSMPCPESQVITRKNPDGSFTYDSYGVHYGVNEGLLLKSSSTDLTLTQLSQTTDTDYQTDPQGQPYPIRVANPIQINSGPDVGVLKPLKRRTINQDGVSFVFNVDLFDEFARAEKVTTSSSLGYSKSDVSIYHDDFNKWVLGQVETVTNVNTGDPVSQTIFDANTASPIREYSFGQLIQTYTYNADGTIATVKDANNAITTLSNYKRGIPQTITFPDTTAISGIVNDSGWLTSITDQLGNTSNYEYDAMGRISKVIYPTGDTNAWLPTNFMFHENLASEAQTLPAGVSVGQWRQSIWNDRLAKVTYFDVLLRPILDQEWDWADGLNTVRYVYYQYDASGRKVFQSYPFGQGVANPGAQPGTKFEYDSLGRVIKTKQDSELGVLNTTVEYLTGFQARVTNPRGFASTTSFQVFDSPDTSRPEIIVSPEGVTTSILRNIYGQTLAVTRGGSYNGNPISSTRQFVYDSQQRLCKRIEPETGAMLLDYDVVGNVAWSTTGSALTSNTCDRASVAAVDKTIRTYNSMNRVTVVDVPGTTDDLSYTYFADGVLQTLTNGSNNWAYTYNKLRLPVTETLTIDGRVKTLTHAYNTMAQESSLTYPSGLVVATAPNA